MLFVRGKSSSTTKMLWKLSDTSRVVCRIYFFHGLLQHITQNQNVGEILSIWPPVFHNNPANNWERIFEFQDFGVPQNSQLKTNCL